MLYRSGGIGEVQTTFAPFGPNTSPMPPKPRISRAGAVSAALAASSSPSVAAARQAPSTGLARPKPGGAPPPAPAPVVLAPKPAAAVVEAVRVVDLAPVSRPDVMPPNANGGGAYYRPSAEEEEAVEAADLQQTPVSASIDVPAELWIGLGILGAATILGGVWIATRPKASGGAKKRKAFSAAP